MGSVKPNKVFLNERDIIEIHVVGDQTVTSIDAMVSAVEKLIKQRRAAKEPVLIMDVLLHMGKVPPEGRRRVVQWTKVLDYDKAVMLGSNPVLRVGANLMLRASGRGDKARYFENFDDAMHWLLH
jgi:hypothetical protein